MLNATNEFVYHIGRKIQPRTNSHLAEFQHLLGMVYKDMHERRQPEKLPRRAW